jgi:Rps23 Pro-64 3,4-dihydroxylase Tpa1-like proline 4-hydroxylase
MMVRRIIIIILLSLVTALFVGITAVVDALTTLGSNRLLPKSVYETILNGRIAVVPEFMSLGDVRDLQRDSEELYRSHYFSTDALASYGTNGQFDPAKDRAVLKLNRWQDPTLGQASVRRQLEARLQDLRTDLSLHLNRPGLVLGDAVQKFGRGSTEIAYTRFGPGAYLQRHVDEHHEELKGVAGWTTPTRRSLSWLIYLNEDWNVDRYGGCLRCFARRPTTPSGTVIGAQPNGDLQIAWLIATAGDPYDVPVFLDSQLGSGQCAMYIVDRNSRDNNDAAATTAPQYITRPFAPAPLLFTTGSEALIQQFLVIDRRTVAPRFRLIESPRNAVSDWIGSKWRRNDHYRADETASIEIPPLAGTLVVFDSVTLPHEVLPTAVRERWACSGWMHEDQQAVHTHPDYYSSTTTSSTVVSST